ncbi:MAG TPA: helix-turn-helix domain-containing protein [Pseudonocardia sp.]|nr:helix-turn-helix domain-containing protein [Pseudonocardia sp.]
MLVDDDSNPFELGCACEIFNARHPVTAQALYRLRIVAPEATARMRDGLFTLGGASGLGELDGADTVVVPNRPDVAGPSRPALLAAIRRAHARGARLIGLCTGAFALAEAGVLDGRRVTVHWQLAEEFRRLFPSVELEPDVLYVDDGDVLTSAGSAAALDLGLHVVRRDHGAEVATHVSRRLVFAMFRDGGQRQFVERPVPAPSQEGLGGTLAWAQARLDEPLSVTDLARRAHVSVTTLHRRFRAELGTTPLAWLTGERVELARRLLEQGATSMDVVAHRSGLGTAANLRSRFRAHTGLSPSGYAGRFVPGVAAQPGLT